VAALVGGTAPCLATGALFAGGGATGGVSVLDNILLNNPSIFWPFFFFVGVVPLVLKQSQHVGY
jgi:hypothetical protein